MRSLQLSIRAVLATAAIALAATIGPPTAGAADKFIPFVTDFPTGVGREYDPSYDYDGARFIPGVPDSSTGALRMLEERRKDGGETPAMTTGDSGVDVGDAIVAGAAGAATTAAAALALLLAGRRRQIPT
jgi:hypothetical protein